MEKWNKIQEFLSLKGKFIMTIFTIEIMGLVAYSVYSGKALPDGLTTLYLVVVGAYTANKTSLKLKDKQVDFENKRNGDK